MGIQEERRVKTINDRRINPNNEDFSDELVKYCFRSVLNSIDFINLLDTPKNKLNFHKVFS